MSPTNRRPRRAIAAHAADDDLFEPSLAENDQLRAFRRPWRPWSIVFTAFFGSTPAAGFLFAMNYRKLGQPERMLPCLLIFGALSIALAFGAAMMIDPGAVADTGRDTSQLRQLAIKGPAILSAVIAASLQTKRFEQYERSAREPDSLWAVGFAAVVLGWLTSLGLLLLALSLTDRLA